MCARGTKQWLNLGNVAENERTFLSRLAVSVLRPRFDTAQEHVSRRAQEDHCVEARVEATLIRNGSRDVEGRSLVAKQKFLTRSSRQTYPPSVSDHSLHGASSVSTTWKPRRASSASAVDLPVPDIPVTRILRTAES